jgi:hypothetical protein
MSTTTMLVGVNTSDSREPINGGTGFDMSTENRRAFYAAWNTRSAAEIKHLYTSGYRPDSPASGMHPSSVFAGGQAPSGFEVL